MLATPSRLSLPVQTEEIIRQGIADGRWRVRLPGERILSKELQVSRWTLRIALSAIARQQLIRVGQGRACVIVNRPRRTKTLSNSAGRWTVGFILPEPAWGLRPSVVYWMEAMRERLRAMDAQLDVYHGARYFGSSYAAALSELTAAAPHDCWALLLSTHAMQGWFLQRQIPVVVAGSSFADTPLPSVDMDRFAVGRHAASALLAKGHRQVGLLCSGSFAGVIDCERGFQDAFANPRYANARCSVVHHDGTEENIGQVLDRLLLTRPKPTALYVQESYTLLTTLSHLAQRRIAPGSDLSLVVGEDEPYFRHITPELTRYAFEPHVYARRFARVLKRAAEGRLPLGTAVQVMAKFIPGATLIAHRDLA